MKEFKWPIAAYIFIAILSSAIDIVTTILSAQSLVKVTEASNYHTSFMPAIYLMLIVLGLTVLKRLGYFTLNWIYNLYSNKIMARLNLDLAKQAFKLDSKTFSDHDTGTFVQRIVSDPERIIDNLTTVVDFIINIASSLVIIIYITTLNAWITLAIAVIVCLSLIFEMKRMNVRRKNRKDVRKKSDQITSLTTEIVRSEKDIKSLGLEHKLSNVSMKNYDAYQKSRFKFDITDSAFWTIRNLIINAGTILTLVLGIFLMDKGLLTLATFMIVYSYNGTLYNFVYSFGQLGNCFVDIKVSHGRMFSLFDEDEFVTEKFGTRKIDNVVGKIEFKDVSFSFKEYDYNEPENVGELIKKRKVWKKEKVLKSENKIFDKLSFSIQPNTTVAFVGRSGSGKSTILNLMAKMYEVDSGGVLIDDIDIREFDKESLRKTISLVNQFPYIFDMTIKENLLLAKEDATDEEIEDAIKRASLFDFVESLPDKLDTKVGESGIKLSGGQKQRLAIARALLRNSSIIIFDESTSSLDNFAQEDVKQSINNLKGKSTIVIVAHRLSTIKDVDEIFFLENGKIVDKGTFDELFKRNEKFHTMFLAENIEQEE